MGAHSTVYIAASTARRLYNELVDPSTEITDKKLESFFDRVLDDRLYNCLLVSDDAEELKSTGFNTTMSDYELRSHLVQYLAENPGERENSLTAENRTLRQLLGNVYRGIITSSNIDFDRDSVTVIKRKLDEHYENARRQWEAAQVNERG